MGGDAYWVEYDEQVINKSIDKYCILISFQDLHSMGTSLVANQNTNVYSIVIDCWHLLFICSIEIFVVFIFLSYTYNHLIIQCTRYYNFSVLIYLPGTNHAISQEYIRVISLYFTLPEF